jgi:DNA-directed RNA polymerase beta' subunit
MNEMKHMKFHSGHIKWMCANTKSITPICTGLNLNLRLMLLDTYEINKIKFGVFSSKEIVRMSVAELTCCKKHGYSTIYDPRLGAIGTAHCETCGQDAIGCPGHFGHVTLNEPVIHPLFVKKILAFLRCQCIECKELLFEAEHLQLAGIDGLKSDRKFKKIVKMATKMDLCSKCLTPQPTYKQNVGESSISMTMLDENKKKITIELTSHQILARLDRLSDASIRLTGFDPESVHPRNFVITHLPVLPPSCRPYVKAAGNLCDDDLSNQYVEIIKANNKLSPGRELTPCKRNKVIQTLKFRIHTTFNNSAGKAKHTTNGRPVKCIKSRISGKDGQMRGNIMGRRADQTARTVIGPATTVKNDEMLVPRHIAEILTLPVRVFKLNHRELEKIVNDGDARFVLKHTQGGKVIRINLDHALHNKGTPVTKDDVIINSKGVRFVIGAGSSHSDDRVANGPLEGDRIFRKKSNGVEEEIPVVPRSRRYFKLEIGDIVERRLINGDYVLLNRQPTLHKASMQAFKIIIHPGKSFRFNLACTKAFNADFDKISVENSRH